MPIPIESHAWRRALLLPVPLNWSRRPNVDRITNRVTTVATVVINGGKRCSNTPSASYAFKGITLRTTLDRGKNTEIPARMPHSVLINVVNSRNSFRNSAPLGGDSTCFSPTIYFNEACWITLAVFMNIIGPSPLVKCRKTATIGITSWKYYFLRLVNGRTFVLEENGKNSPSFIARRSIRSGRLPWNNKIPVVLDEVLNYLEFYETDIL